MKPWSRVVLALSFIFAAAPKAGRRPRLGRTPGAADRPLCRRGFGRYLGPAASRSAGH